MLCDLGVCCIAAVFRVFTFGGAAQLVLQFEQLARKHYSVSLVGWHSDICVEGNCALAVTL
jgi:hypothetical protein